MTSLTEKRGRLLQALMMTYQPTVTIKFNKQRENQKKKQDKLDLQTNCATSATTDDDDDDWTRKKNVERIDDDV